MVGIGDIKLYGPPTNKIKKSIKAGVSYVGRVKKRLKESLPATCMVVVLPLISNLRAGLRYAEFGEVMAVNAQLDSMAS